MLACPHCRSPLIAGPRTWICTGCVRSFPALRGIVDLRVADDAFLPNHEDWARAEALAEDYDRLDFPGLLERYFDLAPEVPANLRKRQVAHILTAPQRVAQWRQAIGRPPSGAVLDLGCGTGSFLVTASDNACERVGIDIAMRWLIVARKRLDEAGLSDVRLVCGCAEALPFRDRSFSAIVAGDVIEHVADQRATLAECHRVLDTGGRLFLASPNRFSLAPEPHVQVWGVGYLPRRWMNAYVLRRRGIEFRAIRTMGYREWRRTLRRSPFGGGFVRCPALPESDLDQFRGLKQRCARWYNRVVQDPVGQRVAKAVGPLFHVVCERAA